MFCPCRSDRIQICHGSGPPRSCPPRPAQSIRMMAGKSRSGAASCTTYMSLMGRSVLPSSNASTRDPRVDRTCSSGLHSKGYIAFIRASSTGLLVQRPLQPMANFSNFTTAEKSSGLLLGTNGACGRVHCRPHPTLSLSIGILMKTSSSLALQSHIAPSHRRLPHLSWTTSFSLLLDLLIGAGKTRYLNTRLHARSHRDVFVRGFSAGSYSGICLLTLALAIPFCRCPWQIGRHCMST